MKYLHQHKLSHWMRFRAFQPLVRATMVVSAVAVMATGITYAALFSQSATLTGNSISSATADLRIGTTASTFYPTRTGFTFAGIIPDTIPAATDGSIFYLKNYGSAPMNLRASISSAPVNTAGVDLDKVYFQLNRNDGSNNKISLASLVSSHGSGGVPLADTLAPGAVAQYRIQVAMDNSAFTGTSATISAIDLSFIGFTPSAQ